MNTPEHKPGKLYAERCADIDHLVQANVNSDPASWDQSSLDAWRATYVSFGGFFGAYGPELFAAAPELLALIREAVACRINDDWLARASAAIRKTEANNDR